MCLYRSRSGMPLLMSKRKAIKSVYMVTDLEGVAGVDYWDPRHSDYASEARGVYERSEAQRLLTQEVNAACEG